MYKIIEFKDKELLYDARIFAEDTNAVKPYLTALVDEKIDPGEMMSCRILKVISEDEKNKTYGRVEGFGDYKAYERDDVWLIKDENMMSSTELVEADRLKKEFEDLHMNAKYHITGRMYCETPSFYAWDQEGQYPYFEIEDEKKFVCPDNVKSIEDAQVWLLKEHPEYYMGCSIVQDCPSGNFCMTAVPSSEYPKGTYETIGNRLGYAKNELERLTGKLARETKSDIEDHVLSREREKEIDEPVTIKPAPEKHHDRNYYIVWLRNDEHRFENRERLKLLGIEPKRKDFEAAYVGSYEKQSLDELYEIMQNSPLTPEDYEARALTVGDMITINDDGRERSFFVDDVGFKEEQGFTKNMYLIQGTILDHDCMSEADIARFEDLYGIDINGDSEIGIDRVPVDPGDRDLDGDLIADKYEER